MKQLSTLLYALTLLLFPALLSAMNADQPEHPQQPDPPHEAHSHEDHGHHDHGEHGEHGEHATEPGYHGHDEHGVHHDFSDAERWAAIFEGDDRDSWQNPQEVVEIMDLRAGMTVADLGAGSGYFLPYLSRAVGSEGKVLGLDPEPNFITFMTERVQKNGWTNVEAREIPLDSPGLEDGSTDRILIVNTWHHIEDRIAYAAKLRQALKKGGSVFIVDFNRESPYGPSVESRLPPEQVLEEIRGGGFEAKVLDSKLPWQYVIAARRP